MAPREFFFACLGTLALWIAATSATFADQPATKPNIIVLFADDYRPDAIGALGHPVVQTPNLDRLVREGFIFRNAYCLGSNVPAVCLPSRNMLLCGRAYFRWTGHYAPADGPNLPRSMKNAGYETYHHGKRGNSAIEIQKSFDHNLYVDDDRERTSGRPGKAIVDHAIRFLKSRDRSRPFFLYLAFEAPHDPRVANAAYLTRYTRETIPLPRNYLPVHPFDNGELLVRDERLAGWPRSEAEIRRHLHEYYAVISGLDDQIGRLLAALEELGIANNTLIVFSADNGLAVGSHGLMGKQSLYEHSMRVPLVFHGPGIQRGGADALVYLVDLFPTFCELVGAPVPDGLDGASLTPILDGRASRVRDTLFTCYRDVQRSVRDERWKLIRYPKINRAQLFDLIADPDETRDVSHAPSSAPIIDRLMAELGAWQQRLGDRAPLSSDPPQDPNAALPAAAAIAP